MSVARSMMFHSRDFATSARSGCAATAREAVDGVPLPPPGAPGLAADATIGSSRLLDTPAVSTAASRGRFADVSRLPGPRSAKASPGCAPDTCSRFAAGCSGCCALVAPPSSGGRFAPACDANGVKATILRSIGSAGLPFLARARLASARGLACSGFACSGFACSGLARASSRWQVQQNHREAGKGGVGAALEAQAALPPPAGPPYCDQRSHLLHLLYRS
mmetsp:Transcript_110780/g.318369  ORF Transcript_110780/g.318369 Transcript_110780/m.318369 type:complete len:220 (-) Transcript_110780:1969-2628(-)